MDSYNLIINKGSTYSTSISLTDADGVPIDLVYYNVSGFLKYRYSNETKLLDLNVRKETPYSSGVVTLAVSSTGTRSLPITTAFYDIKLYDTGDGTVDTILQGKAFIYPEITY